MQNAIVRDLNNIHIFIRQALPLLEAARDRHAASSHTKDRRYFVPFIGRSKFARRTDHELREIYDRFTRHRLYEAFLITAVAEFESFLARVLREIIREYPQKLCDGVPGVSGCKSIPAEILLESDTIDEALDKAIAEHINGVFYARPKEYLNYLSKIIGVDTEDNSFLDYLEIKASRDILIHNSNVANATYLSKAGTKARVAVGENLSVDSEYFDKSLGTLKRLSGILKRDVEKSFKPKAIRGSSA
jgi:hypothetical protein